MINSKIISYFINTINLSETKSITTPLNLEESIPFYEL